MITATIVKKPSGEYVGFQISGHAGYEEAGKDIVCAAVSCLAINTANSIEALTEDATHGQEEDGLLRFRLIGGCSEKSKLLLDSLVLGLNSIREQYGKEYLRISMKEL